MQAFYNDIAFVTFVNKDLAKIAEKIILETRLSALESREKALSNELSAISKRKEVTTISL